MEANAFRSELESLYAAKALPAPARAAAGLALRSTVPVPDHRERYRPFRDDWAPDLLIELKSNQRALFEHYAALTPAARARALHQAHPVALHAIEQQSADGEELGSYWALSRPEALIGALDRVARPLGAGDRELAARYLHFGDRPIGDVLPAQTAWARVAGLYARMYAQAYANDYELLLQTLDQLDRELGTAG
jgi:hypothetical protein